MKIVCDIDGVLADVRKYVEEYLIGKSDWKTYFEHTLEFPPIHPMIGLIRSLANNGGLNTIYLLTGRPETNRELTETWLRRHLRLGSITGYDTLLMSPTKPNWPSSSSRPTSVIKMETIRELKPDLIIDDDPAVVEVATKEGFMVLQVHGFRATKNDAIPFEEVT